MVSRPNLQSLSAYLVAALILAGCAEPPASEAPAESSRQPLDRVILQTEGADWLQRPPHGIGIGGFNDTATILIHDANLQSLVQYEISRFSSDRRTSALPDGARDFYASFPGPESIRYAYRVSNTELIHGVVEGLNREEVSLYVAAPGETVLPPVMVAGEGNALLAFVVVGAPSRLLIYDVSGTQPALIRAELDVMPLLLTIGMAIDADGGHVLYPTVAGDLSLLTLSDGTASKSTISSAALDGGRLSHGLLVSDSHSLVALRSETPLIGGSNGNGTAVQFARGPDWVWADTGIETISFPDGVFFSLMGEPAITFTDPSIYSLSGELLHEGPCFVRQPQNPFEGALVEVDGMLWFEWLDGKLPACD